jgi:hypothetical protein
VIVGVLRKRRSLALSAPRPTGRSETKPSRMRTLATPCARWPRRGRFPPLDALRRGLLIAQDSGNRANETYLAATLALSEVQHGDPLAALEYSTVAIRNHHDSGNTLSMRAALAVLAACLDRLGRHEAAATIAGFAFNPITAAWIAELTTAIAHLRDVLADQTYQSLASKGETMTTAAMARYAYDQIDQARTELNAVSK